MFKNEIKKKSIKTRNELTHVNLLNLDHKTETTQYKVNKNKL